MEAVYKKAGNVVAFTASADKVGGQVELLPDGRAGVIVRDIDYSVNPLGEAYVHGVFTVTKSASYGWKAGDQIWWDAANNTALTIGGDFLLGRAAGDVAKATTTGNVVLNDNHDQGNDVIVFEEDFLGTTLCDGTTYWNVVDVGDATEANVANAHGGEFALTIAATGEAEDAVLYANDVLNFDIDKLLTMEFRAKITTPGTGVRVVAGMGGAHDLDKDTMAQSGWFSWDASLDCKCESDDGTNDNDDIAAQTLTTGVYYNYLIDFTDSSDVKFYIDGVQVATGTTFDMSNYTSGLQPYFSGDKASGTGVAVLTIDKVRIRARR